MISIKFPHNLLPITHYLFSFSKKKEAKEVIYSAEVSVPSSGRDIIEVLKNVRQEMKSNLYLDSALSLLSKGKPRSIAYKNILPANILTLLKTGEAKQVMAGESFQRLSPHAAYNPKGGGHDEKRSHGTNNHVCDSLIAFIFHC